MQIKGLILTGLGVASATQLNNPLNNQQQVGKVLSHEYVQPNVEELCFSVRPVASCDEQHVASYVKYQKVGFHCLNISSPVAKQFQREADQGQKLPLEHKSQDLQAYVEVPTRCERIDTEEKRLRKETEKTSEQKIHLVQNQDGEEESFLFEHKPWTTASEEQQRRLTRKNQNQHSNKNGQNVEDDSDDEFSIDQELDTMNQYGDLIQKEMSMHRVLKMKDDQFDRFMDHLKFIAHSNRRSDKWSQQLDTILPNVYSKVAKQFFETALEQQTNTQEQNEELYQQYVEVVKRIYAYAVKEVLQMKQLNQITGKISERKQQYIINQVARNLWYKFQKEMSPNQVDEVREIAEQIQQNQPQLDRMIIDETLVGVNKEQMKQLEKDLTKVLVAGIKMVNHNNQNNQIQNEEYQRYHGQDYEQEFQREFPKLYQRLATINLNGFQSGNQNGFQSGNQNGFQSGNQNGFQTGNQNGNQYGNQKWNN